MSDLPTESRIFSAYEKHEFFEIMRAQALDLTYGDVRVATGPSDYEERDVTLTTRFSRNVELRNPLVTAAMDTVTESRMAIAMAKLGGLGVIHAAFEDPKQQRNEVRRVKYHMSGLIPEPIKFREDETLQGILAQCTENEYGFRTFPITDANNRVVGILTQDDFDRPRQRANDALAREAMTPLIDLVIGTPEMTLDEAHDLMIKSGKKTVPLLRDDHTSAGLYIWKDVNRIKSGDAALFSLDARGRLLTAAAFSTGEGKAIERIRLMRDYLDVAVIDTSKGDHRPARRALKLLKEEFPDLDIVVGNVSEPEGAYVLAEEGADGIKVGQGPGSICTTRMEIGIGAPQLTAVYNCVEAVRGMDVPICADGGIQNRGDLVVAIAAGAHTIMAGGIFAGTTETPGKVTRDRLGNQVKIYRGMGDEEHMRNSKIAIERYDSYAESTLLAEGTKKEVPFKGDVRDIVLKGLVALNRGISTGRSPSLEHLRENARFRRSTPSGILEGSPHEVDLIG